MKKFFKKLSDIQNAFRVLEIMDACGGVDIEKVDRKGFENSDYWRIKPKGYVSQKEAEDLRKITLYKYHHKKRSRLWKIFFPNIRDGYRFLYE